MAGEILTTEDLREAYPILVAKVEAEAKGESGNKSIITVEKDKNGRTTKWTEEIRDVGDSLVGKRIDEYSYYPGGQTDIITQKKYDSQNELIPGSEKKIQHYLDGRQPEIQEKPYAEF